MKKVRKQAKIEDSLVFVKTIDCGVDPNKKYMYFTVGKKAGGYTAKTSQKRNKVSEITGKHFLINRGIK